MLAMASPKTSVVRVQSCRTLDPASPDAIHTAEREKQFPGDWNGTTASRDGLWFRLYYLMDRDEFALEVIAYR